MRVVGVLDKINNKSTQSGILKTILKIKSYNDINQLDLNEFMYVSALKLKRFIVAIFLY